MSDKIKSMKELERAIAVVEEKRILEWLEIGATVDAFTESLKPTNLARQVVGEFVAHKDMQKILKHVASLAAGLAVHKFTVGKKSNALVKFLGRLAQMSVTGIVDRVLVKK